MKFVPSLLAISQLSFMSVAFAAEPVESHLVGLWVLCQDPDGSPKDSLEFFAEGYGFSRRPNAAVSPFLFKESGGQVMLAVNAKGNLLTIYLSVAADYSRLTLKSARTGSESFYVRAGQEKQNACTAS
jgi:hypothetical protein